MRNKETLEEVALNYSIYNEQINKAIQEAVKFGAKFQEQNSDKKYSEEEVDDLTLLFTNACLYANSHNLSRSDIRKYLKQEKNRWFEQFKKK